MHIQSKLPQLGTTIFSVMSALARQHDAINLSQGFPNFDCDPLLKDRVTHYVQSGFNQYAPMTGVPKLNQVLAQKIERLYGSSYNPSTEINITSGATQAIFSAIHALVHPNDEVIIVEPAYDCYQPSIELAGGVVVPYQIQAPDWKINWEEFEKLISNKTRMIMLNSPHNPSGSLLQASDFEALQQLVEGTDIIILSDEVYEHLVFDGQQHQSVLAYPALRKRSLATYSFGKTLHATGWKLGYIVGDAALMHEFRKVHQFDVFSSNTPMQHAIADYLETPEHYLSLAGFFQQKRDLFLNALEGTGFDVQPSAGTYFQVANYAQLSDAPDRVFAKHLTKEFGVAVIPISAFYHNQLDHKVIRFCFAKTDDTLLAAAERLQKIG